MAFKYLNDFKNADRKHLKKTVCNTTQTNKQIMLALTKCFTTGTKHLYQQSLDFNKTDTKQPYWQFLYFWSS